jgi:hypothetical protein
MKRFGVLMLVLVMALAVLASVAGCGSENKNKTTAKGYMNTGDAFYTEGVKANEDMNKLTPKLMTVKGDEITALMAELTAAGGLVEAAMASAKAEYDKILPLTGVEDYVTYANLQNDIIAMYNDILAAGSTMIEKYLPDFMAGTLDAAALLGGPEYQNLTKIGKDIDKLDQEAQDFKSSKKLAQ